jgi:hypothetical protein
MKKKAADKAVDEAVDAGDPNDVRLIVMFVISGVAALVAGLLYLAVGENWWRLFIVVIGVPLAFWTTARVRDRYMQRVARLAGLSFHSGFPEVPDGSPAHGRLPWGFTNYTMSGQQDGVTLTVYEHSYRLTESGSLSHAHGVWWQYATPMFPEFDVSVRSRLDGLTSLLSVFASRLFSGSGMLKEIEFRQDQSFTARFIVRGASEAQVRRLFTPGVRQALLADLNRGTVGGKGAVLGWDRPRRLWGGRALATLMPQSDRLRRAFTAAVSNT